MKITEYIKSHREWFYSLIGILIIINLILFVSVPLEKSPGEIFYLDLLVLTAASAGLCFHYHRINQVYSRFRRQMAAGQDSSWLFYNANLYNKIDDLGMILLQEILTFTKRDIDRKEQFYQQKMNDLNEYLTHTVHDLKVNLAVCEMVVNRLEDPEGADKLRYQIEQMKFRIGQTLSISRANHYSEDILPEPIAIEQIVKEAITDNREFFINRGIGIYCEVEPYPLVSDRKWIHYILSQILNNSSKYTEEGGEVTISGAEDENGYQLAIKDSGWGIPPAELPRIFDKGFTGTNGRTNTKSTGMGMYYAKKMADILGIGLRVKSEYGRNTEFIVSFYRLSDYLHRKQCEGDKNVI